MHLSKEHQDSRDLSPSLASHRSCRVKAPQTRRTSRKQLYKDRTILRSIEYHLLDRGLAALELPSHAYESRPQATMSRPSVAPSQRNLTLTEELEKLEQSITLTLQGSSSIANYS